LGRAPSPCSPQFHGRIDVYQLISFPPFEIGEFRAQTGGQLLHGEAFAVDELLDDCGLVARNDAGESGGSSDSGKDCATGCLELLDDLSQKDWFDQRHIAREKEFGRHGAGHEPGINASKRSATGDNIAANQAGRESKRSGDSADPLQKGEPAELDVRFVAAHPAAQAAGEDAD
jgi:hypothetical protein